MRDVVSLSEALARSAERASDLTRSLFAGDSWDAERLAAFVNERRNATVASVNADGRPHAAVVIAASVRDAIYFTVTPGSALARNLGHDRRVAITVCDQRHAMMGQGRAVDVGPASELDELLGELAAASSGGRFTPDGWDGSIFTVELSRLFAN